MKTNEPKHTFYLEIDIGSGEYREDEFHVPYDVEPYVPAKLSGPPENCYPAEGGVATGYGPVAHVNSDTREVSEVTWDTFVEMWWTQSSAKTVSDAEDLINEEIYNAWEEQELERDEAALDMMYNLRVDRMRDESL